MVKQATTADRLSFRWRYIVLPLAVLLLSIVLAAYYYPRLPAELATHFKLDGTPDGWLGREIIMVWLLAPQLLLALLAGGIAWGTTRISALSKSAATTWIQPERILLFMGNIVALPQIILCFAMLDIFSYNLYQKHIMPMWLFLLIILALATAIIGALLVLTFLKAKKQFDPRPGQRTKEQE